MKTKQTLRMTVLAMLIALGVVISPFLRVEGMCPMAHFINIVCSVFLGPWYSLLCATLIGIIRMITMGIEGMEETPFHTVLIHGLVRDALGRKMSKSLGNGVDPLEVIDQYGADALRFSLSMGVSPGNDMRFSTDKVEDLECEPLRAHESGRDSRIHGRQGILRCRQVDSGPPERYHPRGDRSFRKL